MKLSVVLLCLAAVYFTARGPWRAIGSVNSYDFASVYGAARCWLNGENPYDMRLVAREIHLAGDNPATFPNTDPKPSVYLPTAFPLLSPVALLPWKAARLVWSLLSIAVFGLSLVLLLRGIAINNSQKWLLAAGILLFSPVSSGLSTGNPSVISCALTLSAIFLAFRQNLLSASLLLGLAHALKPQISIAAIPVLLLWGLWRTTAFSFLPPALAALVSFLRVTHWGEFWVWLATLRNEIHATSLPGGINDASPANYYSYHLVNASAILTVWLRNETVVSAIVWSGAAVLTGAYLFFRRKARSAEPLRDVAFFCTITLVLIYHRYYDAQLLLGAVPFLFTRAARSERATPAIWICMLVLLFPLQAFLAESHPQLNPASPAGFLMLRHQPVVVLLMCVFLVPWWETIGNSATGRATLCDAKVCNS